MISRRLLDVLIVLAVAFALPIFYLIEKIIEFRGNDGDDEKLNLGRNYAVADNGSPPTELPLQISMSGVCRPVQHFVKKHKGVRCDG